MIRIVCIIGFLMLSQTVNAQDSLYFKDLYGFEDSNGQTHLYYQQIDWFEVEGDTVNGYWSSGYKLTGKLRHLNTASSENSVPYTYRSESYSAVTPTYSKSVKDVKMLSDDPGDIVVSGGYSQFIYFEFVKTGATHMNHLGYFTQIHLNPENQDSVFIHQSEGYINIVSVHKQIHPDSLRMLENVEYYKPTDSVGFHIYEGYALQAISPFKDSVYFVGKDRDNQLYKGNLYTGDFESITDSSNSKGIGSNYYFDSDSSHIYVTGDDVVFRSDAFGDAGSWKDITTNFPKLRDSLTYYGDSIAVNNIHLRKKRSGFLYTFSPLSNYLYVSSDYGNTFSIHTTFNHNIQGVYHKPGTDSLYVLTIKDLFLIEGENQTIVDEVPLSADDSEIPNRPSSITLHQNYPNPFNPETTIRFETKEAASVTIDVYDVMGRHVARLFNKRTSAGQHEVVFNAEELSSGVYFYRLVSGNESVTRSMMLVK